MRTGDRTSPLLPFNQILRMRTSFSAIWTRCNEEKCYDDRFFWRSYNEIYSFDQIVANLRGNDASVYFIFNEAIRFDAEMVSAYSGPRGFGPHAPIQGSETVRRPSSRQRRRAS